jgi:hypothetical protein
MDGFGFCNEGGMGIVVFHFEPISMGCKKKRASIPRWG